MKNLILINGTMGAGKTATSLELKNMLPNCAFLDGDWCWNMQPFIVNDETKAMVLDNIGHLLTNFLNCSAYENILFCWVMHEEAIIADVLRGIHFDDYNLYKFSLICSKSTLKKRFQKDIVAGKRTPEGLKTTLGRIENYIRMDTVKIDVSDISAKEAATEIYKKVNG